MTSLNPVLQALIDNKKVDLDVYHGQYSTFQRDFYTTTLNQNAELNDLVEQLLTALNIKNTKRYLNQSLTLHQLFVELSQRSDLSNESRVDDFLTRIHQQRQSQYWQIIFGGLLFATAAVTPISIYGMLTVEQFLTASTVVSIGGLGYTLALGMYRLYHYIPEVEHTSNWLYCYDLLKNNAFELINTVLVAVAWGLMLTSLASNPIISVLFVLGEFAFVVKEAVHLINSYFLTDDNEQNPYQKARKNSDLAQRRYQLAINLTAAILLTIIIAAWCLVPGGLIVPGICLLAMAVVFASKQYAISRNQVAAADLLKKTLDDLDSSEHNVDNAPLIQKSIFKPDNSALKQQPGSHSVLTTPSDQQRVFY
jgi:hypothetical protein